MMLDFKENYGTIQEAHGLKPISNSKQIKQTEKNTSFHRVLNKVKQRNHVQTQGLKNEYHIADSQKEVNTSPDENLAQTGNICVSSSNQQSTSIAGETVQTTAAEGACNQEKAVLDQARLNLESSDESQSSQIYQTAPENIPTLEDGKVQTTVLPNENQLTADSRIVPPETPITAAAETIELAAENASTANLKAESENQNQPMLVIQNLQTSETQSQAVQPTQLLQVETEQNGQMLPDSSQTALQSDRSISENAQLEQLQGANSDLLIQQASASTKAVIAANGSAIADTTLTNQIQSAETKLDADNASSLLTDELAGTSEMTERIKTKQQKNSQATLSQAVNTNELTAEDSQLKSADKLINTAALRSKLMEKMMVKTDQKSVKDQADTDVKKLMLSESQHLFTVKSVIEETSLTDFGSSKGQSENPTAFTGLEKALAAPASTELGSSALAAKSAAQNVDAQDLIEQIVQKVEMLNKDKSNEMRIQLKPGFLGKMIIKIAVEDGLVTAKFYTENQHVKQLLEANLSTLKQNLESQGLKVDRTEVNVQLDNGGSFHGNESGREQMWQEYSDRNDQRNRFAYQNADDYQPGLDAGLESITEITQDHAEGYVSDGRVDFMI